jgi:hypothetical protein
MCLLSAYVLTIGFDGGCQHLLSDSKQIYYGTGSTVNRMGDSISSLHVASYSQHVEIYSILHICPSITMNGAVIFGLLNGGECNDINDLALILYSPLLF